MRAYLVGILFAAACLSVVSCAAIFHGTTDTINVTSEPPGRTVAIDGVPRGTAPLNIEVQCDSEHVVTVDGAPLVLQRDFRAGMLVLDILFTGLIGIIVDAATGAYWGCEPTEVHAR